jgi:hypothetical protein
MEHMPSTNSKAKDCCKGPVCEKALLKGHPENGCRLGGAGEEPASASQSFVHNVAKLAPERRTPLRSMYDDSNVPDQEQTWAAGDRRAQAIGLALKRQLSAPDNASGVRTSRSGPPDAGDAGDASTGAGSTVKCQVTAQLHDPPLP